MIIKINNKVITPLASRMICDSFQIYKKTPNSWLINLGDNMMAALKIGAICTKLGIPKCMITVIN